ncbi:MAG: hypothetical protein JJT85_12000 [Chromatiales bacterium]|nr:hypothetical protein [Chromatiales bacterium]
MDFIDLSLATYGGLLDGKRALPATWFAPIRAAYTAETVSSFQDGIGRTFPELVTFFRSLPDAKRKVASEYYEFPALARYPFYRTGDTMICWHPTILYRRLEGFVHSVLRDEGQRYIEQFSRLFERHVVNETRRVSVPFMDEEDLRRSVARDTKVPDGLLSFPDCNVFIESKAGRFDESVMTAGNREIFEHKTRALQMAVRQAWSACVSLRLERRAPPDVLNASMDYLLIVTNKELGGSRGTTLAAMYPDGTFEYPNTDAKRYLPLSRIYTLSIDDYERLIGAAANREVDIPTFLASCVRDDDTPETSLFLFEQHLNRRGVSMRFSSLIEDAIYESECRLMTAFRA